MNIKLAGITDSVDIDRPIYNQSNFTWAEVTKGGARLPENTVFDGKTIDAAQITSNIVKLAHELDKVRVVFGNCPITITSWYRPTAVNRAVGGVSNSQHLLGWAADIQIQGYQPHQVAARLDRIWQGGLGDSVAFTHLDLRHLMGWSAARWDYGNA